MIKLDLEGLELALAEATREVLPLLDMEEGEHGIPLVAEKNNEGPEVYLSNDGSLDEDTVMMDALDAGADDFTAEDDIFEITTEPDVFAQVRDALEAKEYKFETCEIQMIPQNYITLTDEHDILMMEKLIDNLEDNDDVQNIYHNWEMAE